MKSFKTIIASVMMLSGTVYAADANTSVWTPVKDTMLTQWGEQLTADNAWQQYPRPQLQRANWKNLNGLWQYAVRERRAGVPDQWQGTILVPFSIESALSGVGQRLTADQALWYQTQFNIEETGKRQTKLNFEAVDYASKVWVNGQYIGEHRGGNLPFSFDISNALQKGTNTLVIRVIDDTDAADRYQLRGKQTVDNRGIWYTPVSGIWQTVWLEQVEPVHITRLKMNADAKGHLSIDAAVSQAVNTSLQVDVSYQGKKVASGQGSTESFNLTLSNAKLWSPSNPHLYELTIRLLDGNNQQLDQVSSYVGFRTFGKQKDSNGNIRFTLNGKEIFHWGPLDQGWWPDGLLTPPSEEAMVSDLKFLKAAGFNMVRKHIKVEPRRYYYQADKLGLLIWQDQVSGGVDSSGNMQEWPHWFQTSDPNPNRLKEKLDSNWPEWAHQQYMDELKDMIDVLYNHPSIAVWTTFNERWGQHNSMKVGRFVSQYDPTRYLNVASGGNFVPIGDIADSHHYPEPEFLLDAQEFDGFVKVIGEFGGHGWTVDGHMWAPDGDKMLYGDIPKSLDEYKQRYIRSIKKLAELKKQGVAAGVYTQTSDVETEINGLLTYDRKVSKITAKQLKKIEQQAGLVK